MRRVVRIDLVALKLYQFQIAVHSYKNLSHSDIFVPSSKQFAKIESYGGRPKLAQLKVPLTIRYDADVIEYLKAGTLAGKRE